MSMGKKKTISKDEDKDGRRNEDEGTRLKRGEDDDDDLGHGGEGTAHPMMEEKEEWQKRKQGEEEEWQKRKQGEEEEWQKRKQGEEEEWQKRKQGEEEEWQKRKQGEEWQQRKEGEEEEWQKRKQGEEEEEWQQRKQGEEEEEWQQRKQGEEEEWQKRKQGEEGEEAERHQQQQQQGRTEERGEEDREATMSAQRDNRAGKRSTSSRTRAVSCAAPLPARPRHHPLPMFPLHCLLFLPLLLRCSFAQQCPPLQAPCRCAPSVYEPVAIICENAGSLQDALHAAAPAKQFPIDSLSILDTAIPSLPAGAFSDWTLFRLVLNRNTLSQVEEGAFDGIPLDSLAELDLSDNSLANIGTKPGGICQLRNLRKLYLNRNGIAQLSPQLFASFSSREVLQKLELRGNKLTDQSLNEGGPAGDGTGGHSGVFTALKNLQELSLETNGLSAVPSAALSAQRETLTNLNLGLNQIKEVPVGALNFPELTSLSLEFNGLPMIVPQAFQHVPRLQYLYLTGNKFPAWAPDMFRFIPDLRTLGIGETPISVIPANAFIHTTNLVRLEMSEAAVDTIEPGAFQRTPMIQAIVLNKNRLTRVRADMFQGLQELYSLDLQGNRLGAVEPRGFANLPALRHLDISYNLLQTLPMDTFDGTFEPSTDDRRVIYACENPWMCDSQLEWFRQLLRDNLDIDIDKPGCVAACGPGMECPPEGTPLRALDFCPSQEGIPPPMPLAGTALSLVGWIILAAIMTVLLISICLMALLRYGMSHRRKKMKEQEIEDEQRIMSSAASAYQQPPGLSCTLPRRTYATIGGAYGTDGAGFGSPIELDLAPAHNLDDRSNYFM